MGEGEAEAEAVGVGLAKGLKGTGQPGATVIWGLALTSKLAASASLECPAMVGAEGGRLVPIKLLRVTVTFWKL